MKQASPSSPHHHRPACPPTPTPSTRPDQADPVTPPPEEESRPEATGRGADRQPIDGAPPAPSPSSPPAPPSPPLSTRLATYASSLLRRTVTAVLRAGPTPQHVAFIMDGNRRFAEARGAAVVVGHEAGYQKVRSRGGCRGPDGACGGRAWTRRWTEERRARRGTKVGCARAQPNLTIIFSPSLQLIDALDWCLALGVSTVSVFAFSVDNFRRPAAEVSALMDLAAERLGRLASPHGEAGALLARHGVRVRILGDRALLPPAVAAAAYAAEDATACHAGGKTLNVCLAYAARVELAAAVEGAAGEVLSGNAAAAAAAAAAASPPPPCPFFLAPGSLPPLLDRHLYTAGAPPVDLLVRSSGEARLSDFLTWQARGAALAWARPLWPDLGFLDLARAVAGWQRASPALDALRAAAGVSVSKSGEAAAAAPPQPPPPPPPPAAAAHPPPPPVGVPRRRRGGGGAGGTGAAPPPPDPTVAWAARPLPVPPPPFRPSLRRPGASDDDEDDDPDVHVLDPQCPCCLPGVLRRRVVPVAVPAGAPAGVLAAATAAAVAEAASQPAGLEGVFAAKRAREAAVRAAMAAAREGGGGGGT